MNRKEAETVAALGKRVEQLELERGTHNGRSDAQRRERMAQILADMPYIAEASADLAERFRKHGV